MKRNLSGFAGNLLFALNIFIVFLLIFEDKITIPYWLQPIGRMHPMIIHFSIVILILAMFLEFFRFKSEFNTQDLYHRFASNLLLIGALAAAVTVIMGLFLSREEGYSGATLQWHKWFGVSIVFFASAIYWSKNTPWYKVRVAKAGALITFFCLIFAGHYGATLSHGENFVLEPVLAQFKNNVPIEEALVFDDVVQPLFQEKCVSCHSSSKLKGNLILTNASSVLKGGKSGKLFVPGKPELSLLLERIHLPANAKKHMPPKDEAQLSEDEIALLFYWIKGNADMNKKVVDLPYTDSLRILASAFLKPADKEEEQFNFAAADKETIQNLNNSYRVVYAISKESPALAVNIYNKSTYTPQVLDELGDVKKQIVSLELNKMPVQDADLKYVSRFENLRTLNLNFTDISGKGLDELTSLKHLKNLSISGTKINYQDLQEEINSFKSLNKLTVWNTQLKESEIKQLQKLNKNVELIFGFKDDGTNPIQLPPPLLKNRSTVFSQSLPVEIKHPINGVDIRYTMDGTEPDSLNSPIFKGEVLLKENTIIKARAFKTGWFSSNPIEFRFYKSKYKPDSVFMLSAADPDRLAEGNNTFFDNILGTTTLPRSTSEKWIGYARNNLEVLLQFKKEKLVSSVSLNILERPETGMYAPTAVEIWGGSSKTGMKLLSTIKPTQPARDGKPLIKTLDCKFAPRNLSYIKVVAKPLKELPRADRGGRGGGGRPVLSAKDRAALIARLRAAQAKAGAGAGAGAAAAQRRRQGGNQANRPGGRPQAQQSRPAFIMVDEIFIN